jgi:hypothetical protein
LQLILESMPERDRAFILALDVHEQAAVRYHRSPSDDTLQALLDAKRELYHAQYHRLASNITIVQLIRIILDQFVPELERQRAEIAELRHKRKHTRTETDHGE